MGDYRNGPPRARARSAARADHPARTRGAFVAAVSRGGAFPCRCGWPQAARLIIILSIIAIVVVVLFASSRARAGAWTMPVGMGQVIVTGTFQQADRYFDSRGRSIRGPDYRKFEASAFIEYGLTDAFTAILSPSLLATRVSGPEPSRYTGLGYTEIGGRYRLFERDGWVVAAQAIASFPGPTNPLSPAQVCCAEKQADARLLVGKSFMLGNWPSFDDVQAAYRLRAGIAPDELRFDVAIGTRPWPNWLLLAQSFNVLAINALATDEKLGLLSGTRYHKVQVGAVWDFADDWSLQLAGIATVAGRSAPLERGIITGLWYRF